MNLSEQEVENIIVEQEKRGTKIVEYLDKYKGQPFYRDIVLAIEFGYQLSLDEDATEEKDL